MGINRRWFQFRITHLLLATTLLSLFLAWVVSIRRQVVIEKEAFHEIRMMNGAGDLVAADESYWTRFCSYLANGPSPSSAYIRLQSINPEQVSWGPLGPGGSIVSTRKWEHESIRSLGPTLKKFSRIKTLSFRYSPLPEGMLVEILPYSSQLEYLNLSGTGIHPKDLIVLNRTPNLKILVVSETRISDDELDHVAALKNLRAIYLESTPITNEGIKKLAALENLEIVDFGRTRITNEVMPILVQLKVKEKILLPAEWTIEDEEFLQKHSPAGCEVRRY
jgi:hypothetical protein